MYTALQECKQTLTNYSSFTICQIEGELHYAIKEDIFSEKNIVKMRGVLQCFT